MQAVLNVASELVVRTNSDSPSAYWIFVIAWILVEHFMYIIYLYHLEQLFNLFCIPASAFLSMGVKLRFMLEPEKKWKSWA